MMNPAFELSPDEWVAIQARLLGSTALRRLLREDPNAFARQLGIGEPTLRELTSVDATALERQAQGLLEKRWHEIRKRIPRTAAQLGSKGYELFLVDAERTWPEGHRRHWLDAWAFVNQRQRAEDSRVDAAEAAMLQFIVEERRLRVCLHRRINGARHSAGPGIQILWRTSRVRSWNCYVAIHRRS